VLAADIAVQGATLSRAIADVNARKLTPTFVLDVVSTELATGKLFLDVQQITHSSLATLEGPLLQLQLDLVKGFLAGVAGNTAGAQQALMAQVSDLTQVFNALTASQGTGGANKNAAKQRADATILLQDTVTLGTAVINQDAAAVATAQAAETLALNATLLDLAGGPVKDVRSNKTL
jgi:hypothetical protein